jgi:signal transduction histidine kinase
MVERDERMLTGQDAASNAWTSAEIEQLGEELAEAREQLAATSEVLAVIGRSASNLEAVLETVVESARKLCGADASQVLLVDGDRYRLAYGSGMPSEWPEYIANNPVAQDRGTLAGRVGLDREVRQIPDVLADPDYGRPDAQRVAGFRTIMGVPMLVEDEVVGVLCMWRTRVDPFSERAADVLKTFAAQAALAVRTVDLVRALQSRTAELAGKVDQLEALGTVGQAVSSSLNLTEVLTTVITQAVLLSGTDGGSIYEFDGDAKEFRVRAVYGTSPELLDALRGNRIGLEDTFLGKAVMQGRPIDLPDLHDASLDPHLSVLAAGGWRSLVAVPMLHEGRVVGALVVRRRVPGPISEDICDLLETFASQSALALIHAQLYRRLKRQSAALELASRHKSEFLASMSHELRTPLNAIIGFSQVLLARSSGELNERQDGYVRDILSSGRHLLELLNDILDLSKIEAGQMVMERSEFVVAESLEYCLSQVRERAREQGIRLSLEVNQEVGLFYADRLRFSQVLLNLLSNAVKFTPDGGRVDVSASMRGQDLVVTVADTGVGVAAEDHQRIFDSFQQGTRRAGQAEGTGLGLTLSKRIVELHEGRIWIESEPGKGSTFGFALPHVSEDPALQSVPLIEPDAGLAEPAPDPAATVVVVEDDRRSFDLLPDQQHTVVAIDDEPRAIELVRASLEPEGWTVLGAATGQEGVALIRERQPSVVLLDLLMPGMDGFEVVEAIRAEPDTKSIPVVILTSKEMTWRDKERLQGRTTYVARKAEFDMSGLAGLLRWASARRQS